jgi:hypothetical protein
MCSPALRSLVGLAGPIVLCAVWPCFAQAKCEWSSLAAAYPLAAQATSDWESRRDVHLTQAAREVLGGEFCAAAHDLTDQLGVSAQELNAAAANSVSDYLDGQAAGTTGGESLSQRLWAQFALGSMPSAPEIKMLGRLNIHYLRKVDRLRVGTETMPPWPVVLSEVGAVTVSGFFENKSICRAVVTVQPTIPAEVTC